MQQSPPRQKKKGPPAQSPGRSPNRRSPPRKRRGAQNLQGGLTDGVGTLAHDLKAEPESVALPDGRKIACRASTKVISFSAHSDYPETVAAPLAPYDVLHALHSTVL